MKNLYQVRLSNRQKQHEVHVKSLIDVLNQLDENNAYKDTKRYYALLADSHWLRARIDVIHREIEYLQNKIKGESLNDN